MSKAVYKNEKSKEIIQDLYDKQVSALKIDFEDIYVDTRYGKTHLLKTGNPDGLGFKKMICMGGSYGGGVLMKLMCVAPKKISKAILLVPSGICNASNASIMFTMGIPMILYKITQNKKWLTKAILPMAIDKNEIDKSTFKMVKYAFDNVRVKAGMPSNVKATDMKNYTAPTLLLTGEKDVLFPGAKVIARAKTIIPNLKTYLMKGSGHMCILTSEKNKNVLHIIVEFLEE